MSANVLKRIITTAACKLRDAAADFHLLQTIAADRCANPQLENGVLLRLHAQLPGMIMRIPHVGSQSHGLSGREQERPRWGQDLQGDAAAERSRGRVLVFTLYDNQTRSMLDTPQRFPRAGSQNYPSPAAEPNADGSTTVYFGPTQPTGVKRGNWIQTTPGKGWFTLLRLYSPLESFFTKEWRLSEIELVR